MIKVNGKNIKDIRYNGMSVSKVMRNGQVLYSKPQDNLISTIILNQNLTDPATMISGDVNGPAIQWIRNNSHNYLVKKTGEGIVAVCQLDDSTRNKYYDGSPADLTGAEGDVMMKLPYFAYKAVEAEPDIWHISFAQKPVDNTWKVWEGNDMIGCYESFADAEKVYSRSGVDSTGNISQQNYKIYARNRGDGYTIVRWEHQNIMAFLFYALYGNTNSQDKIGRGVNSYTKTTGVTDTLGMKDTVAGGNGDSNSINFFGLENWWGNKYEWIDNVVVNPSSGNGVWRVTDTVTGETRDIAGMAPNNSWNWIKTVVIGEYLDIVVKEAGMSETTGYCDGQYLSTSASHVVARSCNNSYSDGGVAFVYVGHDSTFTYLFYCSRLAFRGVIREAESVESFKNIKLQ